MNPQLFNIIGLILNMIGVVILFRHGMPPSYNEGYVEIIPEPLYNKSKRYSNVALGLIFFGFILQLISSCLQFNNTCY